MSGVRDSAHMVGQSVACTHQLPAVEEDERDGQVGEERGGDGVDAVGTAFSLVQPIVFVELGAVQPDCGVVYFVDCMTVSRARQHPWWGQQASPAPLPKAVCTDIQTYGRTFLLLAGERANCGHGRE